MLTLILKSLTQSGVPAFRGLTVGTRSGFSIQVKASQPMGMYPFSSRHGSYSKRLPEPNAWCDPVADDALGNSARIRAGRSAASSWACVFRHCPACFHRGTAGAGGLQTVNMTVDLARVQGMSPVGEKLSILLPQERRRLSDRALRSEYQDTRTPPPVAQTKD